MWLCFMSSRCVFQLLVIESFLPAGIKSFVEKMRVTLKNVCSVIKLQVKVFQKKIIFLLLKRKEIPLSIYTAIFQDFF